MIKIPADYHEKHNFFVISTVVDEPIDWRTVFGNDNPVHLEIGAGKGEFISGIAARNPDINYVAVELKHKRIVTILKKLNIDVHRNVRLMELCLDETIGEKILLHSIDCIYIQHPDPWPKRKHHKNRLIQQEFLDCLSSMLKMDGRIELSTDHTGYRDWIIGKFKDRDDFVSLFADGYSLTPGDEHIITFFETEKRKEGFEPCFMKYKKVR